MSEMIEDGFGAQRQIYFPDRDAMYARNPRLQFIADALGTRNWCVAHRLTERLKRQGYERVVSSKRLDEIEREWEHANPDDARTTGGRLLHELRLSDDELSVVRMALDDRQAMLQRSGCSTAGHATEGALRAIESLKSGESK